MDIIVCLLIAFVCFVSGFFVSYLFFSKKLAVEREYRIKAEARLEEMKKVSSISVDALKENTSFVVDMVGKTIQPVKELLQKFEEWLVEMEKKREVTYKGIEDSIKFLLDQSEKLKVTTDKLAAALTVPRVRGKWGEIALRNILELSGLIKESDFYEQVKLNDSEKAFRPDVVVKLPGGKYIAIDAKVPLESFFEAIEEADETKKEELFKKHARSLKEHVKRLSDKKYWEFLKESPDFTIMFLPSDALLIYALEFEKNLLEEAAKVGVIIATPTILLSILKVIALSWKDYTLSEDVKKLVFLGREISGRIGKFVDNFSLVGKKLAEAVDAYNRAVGSWVQRVAPSFRKFADLCSTSVSDEPSMIEKVPRILRERGNEETE